MKRSLLLLGALFGLLAPGLGLFLGLQISPILGTILIFPFILTSLATDVAVGQFSAYAWIALACASIICWAILFGFAGLVWDKTMRTPHF